ncbi:hypothetical protein Moror_15029 [Moniliophthora roreri MCA 2997]|uniref:F-box domain-containing protein n=2 Tax=Moniliophthora roreri TaxID=221103 RepID=V2W923_MONRO|nr:hypothetical protein Moror_15029 [Moniliophthora roreri MCA 2997]
MARLQDIALEVFEKIAARLNKQDQKSLRLVDKHASIFAKSTVFKSMIMPPVRTSITELMQTLASDQFDDMARHVQHLNWNGLSVDMRGFERLDEDTLESALKKFLVLRELKLALQADTPEAISRAFFGLASSAHHDLVHFSVDGKGKPPTNSDILIDLLAAFTSKSDTYRNAGLSLRRPIPPGLPPSLPFSALCNLQSLHVRSGMMKSFQNQVIEPLSLAIPDCPNLTHLTLDLEGPFAISRQRSYSQLTPRLVDIFSPI